MREILGIDVGGSGIKAALVDVDSADFDTGTLTVDFTAGGCDFEGGSTGETGSDELRSGGRET